MWGGGTCRASSCNVNREAEQSRAGGQEGRAGAGSGSAGTDPAAHWGGGRKRGQEQLSKKEISPCPGFPNCNNFPWANQGGARQTHQIRKVNTRRGRGRRAQLMKPPPKANHGSTGPRLSPPPSSPSPSLGKGERTLCQPHPPLQSHQEGRELS